MKITAVRTHGLILELEPMQTLGTIKQFVAHAEYLGATDATAVVFEYPEGPEERDIVTPNLYVVIENDRTSVCTEESGEERTRRPGASD